MIQLQTFLTLSSRLERIEHLSQGHDPFYIQIAPAAPHTAADGPCVPLARHMWSFNDAQAPRRPNFNPPDKYQSNKPSFLKSAPLLTDEEVNFVDWSHRSRLQGLMGVDEIVTDVLKLLEDKNILDNTYGREFTSLQQCMLTSRQSSTPRTTVTMKATTGGSEAKATHISRTLMYL